MSDLAALLTPEDRRIIDNRLSSARDMDDTQQVFKEAVSQWLDKKAYDKDRRNLIFRYAEAEADRELRLGTVTLDDIAQAQALCRTTARQVSDAAWYATVVTAWPAPVAHEMERLVEELDGRQAGGTRHPPSPASALLQMRDTYEVLMKFTATILVRALIESGEEQARWARAEIFRERASAGSWRALLHAAAARVAGLPALSVFHRLAKPFKADTVVGHALSDFVAARNQEIGHGTLSLNPTETAKLVSGYVFTREPKDKTKVTTLASARAYLADANVFEGMVLVAGEGADAVEFTGAERMRGWHDDPDHAGHDKRTVPLFLQTPSGGRLSLAPFIAGRVCDHCSKRDVLLYDSVFDRDRGGSFDLLDYARGHHSRYGAGVVNDLASTFSLASLPQLDDPFKELDSLNDDGVVERLDHARVDRNYLSPKYLRDDLAALLAGHDRGVFWLRAPAHVGKTTFVQGLSEPALSQPYIDHRFGPGPGGWTAAYYCKKEYRTGLPGFLTAMQENIRLGYNLARELNAPEPDKNIVLKAADQRSAFLAWVEAWRERARQYAGARVGNAQLLLIIDGLDEADDPAKQDSVIDILPRPDELPAGLYLLLTSRPPSQVDCPDFVKRVVAPLYPQNGSVKHCDINLDSGPYRKMLLDYIARARNEDVENPAFLTLAEKIIEQAEGRFIYVSFLMARVAQMGDAALAGLGQGKDIYKIWLANLDLEYGPKQADAMRHVLVTLAAVEEAHRWIFTTGKKTDLATGGVLAAVPEDWRGLPIDILAILTSQDRLDVKGAIRLAPSLIQTLFALQSALGVWRGDDGAARYRLGLKDFLPTLQRDEVFAVQLRLAHARIASRIMDAADSMSDGSFFKAAELAVFLNLLVYLSATINLSASDLLRKRYNPDGLVKLIDQRDDDLIARGHGLRRIPWWTMAVGFRLDQTLPGSALDENSVSLRNAVAAVYINRGIAKRDASDLAGAIADYDAAITLREAIRQAQGADWAISYQNDLANAYMNRGNAKWPASDLTGAIADYDAAITLMGSIRQAQSADWAISYQNDLAAAYLNRGNAKWAASDLTGAIADYDAAITLREAIRQAQGADWAISYQNDLAGAYMNRGNAKGDASDLTGAIADFVAAITLREAIRQAQGADWAISYQNDLANAYMNRGNAKRAASDLAGAIADFDAAIALSEAIRQAQGADWAISFQNDLAGAYMNRGNAKWDASDLTGAIADYDAAITLMEAIRMAQGADWAISYQNDLAAAYMNRGNAKGDASDLTGAIADYDAAITLREAIRQAQGADWAISFQNSLAMLYFNLALLKQSAGERAAACANAKTAESIWAEIEARLGRDMPALWQGYFHRVRGFIQENCPD